ncbi:MAG: phosphoribosylamine--glycine ligase [Dehalococcoidia bacterium]
MKVLVIGSGGREHAISWKLAQSRRVSALYIAPGNAGTSTIGENLPVGAEDLEGLIAAAHDLGIDLTIVGPEGPLVAGIADAFSEAGLKVFGPTAAASRIEGSKLWSKDLMRRHGIPTGWMRSFTESGPARLFIRERPVDDIVLKVNGLAAGKGVILPESHAEADDAISAILDGRIFGDAGSSLLVEERLSGPEVSVFAFLDGATVSAEVAACDYKRIDDGDQGPNTGGMGAYSPPEFWTAELAARVRRDILEATATAMVKEGCPFRGILYAGLMLTEDGPKVIEFNCRLGDPEAEVVLPRLSSDLADVCMAVVDGQLGDIDVSWGGLPHAGVVLVSGGYPGKYSTGVEITGLDAAGQHALVFHAGTQSGENGQVLTAGGRVLVTVGSGEDMKSARMDAYRAAGVIKFEGSQYRSDIAARAITAS